MLDRQKIEIDREISATNSKIINLEAKIGEQKTLLEAIQSEVNAMKCQSTVTDFNLGIKTKKKLIVIGDSLIKHLDLNLICPNEDNMKVCLPGARIGIIHRELRKLAMIYDADHIIIVVGTNHHQENSAVLSSKLKFLLKEAKELFADSNIYYSAYLPKFNDTCIPFINDVFDRIRKICWGIVDLIYNSQLIENGIIDYTLLARDRVHLSKKGVAALGSNFKYRIRKYVPRTAWSLGPGRVPVAATNEEIGAPSIDGFQHVVNGTYTRPVVDDEDNNIPLINLESLESSE